jgi:hypothetical protein
MKRPVDDVIAEFQEWVRHVRDRVDGLTEERDRLSEFQAAVLEALPTKPGSADLAGVTDEEWALKQIEALRGARS